MTQEAKKEPKKYPLFKQRTDVQVGALKIKSIRQSAVSGVPGADGFVVMFYDESYPPLVVSHEWQAKHLAAKDGYIIEYTKDDKTVVSYAPGAPFEEGYELVEA